MQYGPKIVTDSLVLALDAADNNSAPHNDLPVKQGCLMWLDGADDSVFTYSSGTLVSEWRDKSGNNNHVSNSNSARHPSRNVTINSKSAVNFSSDSLVADNVFASTATSYTKIAVVYQTARTDSGNVISSSSGHAFYFGGTTYIKLYHGGTFVTSSVALADNTAGIISGTVQYNSSTSASGEVFVNGTSGGTGTTSNASISSTQVQIGSYNNANYFNGYIAEALVYDRVLSSDELTKVHNYLQNKWNIKVSDSRWYSQTANGYTFGKGGDPVFYETNKGYFDFDGSDDRMDMPGSDRITYSTTEAWTHEIVIDPGSNGIATSWNAIFGDYLNNGGYWFFHNGGQLSWYDAIISGSGRLWYTGLYLGTDIPYDTITHITITHDGSAGLKVFINGVQQRSTTRTFETSYSGSIKIMGAGSSDRYGTSKIYLFRNYNKQLSDAEILQNYNATKGRYL